MRNPQRNDWAMMYVAVDSFIRAVDLWSIMQTHLDIGYVKHNRTRLKAGSQEANRRMLLEFFDKLEGKVKGIKGHVILENANDPQEMLILTFWQTNEDMNTFYNPNNTVLAELVEKSKPYLEMMPERTDYKAIGAKF